MLALTRRRWLAIVAGVIVVAGATVLIALYPIGVTYRLWRYRSDPDAFNRYLPQLCERGEDVKPYVYEAFAEHGKDADVAAFRVAVVHTLRCLRSRREGLTTIEDRVYETIPADPELVATIVRAHEQEPDPELRAEMFVFLWELDYRARFAIYAGIAAGPYPIPDPWNQIPWIDPFDHGGRLDAIADEWCRVVAPVVRAQIEAGTIDGRIADDATRQLRIGNCGADDAAMIAGLTRSGDRDRYRVAVDLVVERVKADPTRSALALPLFTRDTACDDVELTAFRLGGKLDPAVAREIAATAQSCRALCARDPDAPCGEVIARMLTRAAQPAP